MRVRKPASVPDRLGDLLSYVFNVLHLWFFISARGHNAYPPRVNETMVARMLYKKGGRGFFY